jgi:hypothetical protein
MVQHLTIYNKAIKHVKYEIHHEMSMRTSSFYYQILKLKFSNKVED